MKPALVIAALLACAPAQTPQFAVASVRPASPATRVVCDERSTDPVHFRAINCPLRYSIAQAWGMSPSAVIGGPAWLDRTGFNIEATSASPADHDQTMRMLRSLLADRFQLQVHNATRPGRVYALTLASSASKLTPTAHPSDQPFVGFGRDGDTHAAATSYFFNGTNATTAQLAAQLLRYFRAPVADHTGLTGHYDFTVHFTDATQDPGAAPALPTALEQQLGLKLTAATGPVTVLVIDHAALPTAN